MIVSIMIQPVHFPIVFFWWFLHLKAPKCCSAADDKLVGLVTVWVMSPCSSPAAGCPPVRCLVLSSLNERLNMSPLLMNGPFCNGWYKEPAMARGY